MKPQQRHAREKESQDRNAAARAARTAFLADLRATFDTEHGKRILAALGQSARVNEPVFMLPASGGPADPISAAHHDGRRSVILDIHRWLAEPPDEPAKGPEVKR